MVSSSDLHTYPKEFEDIAPFEKHEFKEKLASLTREPGFEHAIRFILPEVEYDAFVRELLKVEDVDNFQRKIVGSFLEILAKRTTSGITCGGTENIDRDKSYTFLSNHRDIVLDASFLNLCFIRANLPITQIAIGNNLLIYDWIRDLVKINRSFIVKRDVKPLQALEAARQLSKYIHYTINVRKESVWIAQREGRAKDSNDITQESLLKMMALGGEGSVKDSLAELNILPVSISYEYDPNDYLKLQEFLMKRRYPDFKKSQRDDLFSMETGMTQFKGNIHFQINRPVNGVLENSEATSRPEVIRLVRETIDHEIHRGYKIFPINYIAFDLLHRTDRFVDKYSPEQVNEVESYWSKQIARIDITDITADEHEYLREMLLSMYANPLKNQLAVTD